MSSASSLHKKHNYAERSSGMDQTNGSVSPSPPSPHKEARVASGATIYDFAVSGDLIGNLRSIHGTVLGDAIEACSRKIPLKILALEKIIKEHEQRLQNAFATESSYNTDTFAQILRGEHDEFKRELLDLMSLSNSVKLWLQLNVPRVEDGNNFGVSVQEDIIDMVSRPGDWVIQALSNSTTFWAGRARLLGKMSKVAAHASNVDTLAEAGKKVLDAALDAYRIALEEGDRQQMLALSVCWLDLRNNYLIIQDTVAKNIDKLLNPRSSNASSMY